MQKMSTHVLLTSRKHMTRFLVKSFGECCGTTVLMAACYCPSSHCVPAQKFMSVSTELNHNRSPLVVGLRQGCVLSLFLFIVYMNWINCHSRADEGVTVESCRINRLLCTDDLVLLASSDQGLQRALARLSAACNRAQMKIATKLTQVLNLCRNPIICTLQVAKAGNPPQQARTRCCHHISDLPSS